MNELHLTDDPSPQEERIGAYCVLGQIARGAISRIVRARDEREERVVAIKILDARFAGDPDAEIVFRREAETMRRVRHPNIARIFDSGIASGGRPYLVMEHIQGPTLERLIRDRMGLSCAQKIDLMLQACEGLQAALSVGVIHRDIKPGNLLIDSRSHLLKIVDFGLARTIWDSASSTNGERVMGTPRYMSPEHCTGHGIDHRSDIYSTGATFYHLLAGQPPHDAPTDAEIMEKHLTAHPVPISEINPDLPNDICQIVMRMIERDPNDRYQDYDSLITEIDEAKLAELSREDLHFRQIQIRSGHAAAGITPPEGMRPVTDEETARANAGFRAHDIPAEAVPPLPEDKNNHFGLILFGLVLLLGAILLFGAIAQQGNGDPEDRFSHRVGRFFAGSIAPASKNEIDPTIRKMIDNEKIMRQAVDEIRLHRSRRGEWPAAIPIKDAWGHALVVYKLREIVASAGLDGQIETDDDWIMRFSGELTRAPLAYRNLFAVDKQYGRKGRI